MAGRILNRRQLRERADHAAQPDGIAADPASADPASAAAASAGTTAVVAAKKRAKAKAAATPKAPKAPKVRKPRKPKAPARLRARWGVFDAGMKQVAVFDYNQRAAADEKLADLLAKKKSIHFLQIVKEAMREPAPVEAAAAE